MLLDQVLSVGQLTPETIVLESLYSLKNGTPQINLRQYLISQNDFYIQQHLGCSGGNDLRTIFKSRLVLVRHFCGLHVGEG